MGLISSQLSSRNCPSSGSQLGVKDFPIAMLQEQDPEELVSERVKTIEGAILHLSPNLKITHSALNVNSQPVGAAHVISESVTDQSQENQGQNCGTQRKSRVQMKLSPVDENVDKGLQTLLTMSEDDILRLLEKLEEFCPPVEMKPAEARAEIVDWDKLADDDLSGEDYKNVWLCLMQTKKPRRNMWDYVHQIKYSMEHDARKYRMGIVESCPGFPEKPAGLLGGQNMYIQTKFAERKGQGIHVNFVEFYKEAAKSFRSLPAGEKQMWTTKSAELAQMYEEEVQKFYERVTGFLLQSNSKTKEKLDSMARNSSDVFPICEAEVDPYDDAPRFPSSPLETFTRSKFDPEDPPAPHEMEEINRTCLLTWNQMGTTKKLFWIRKVIQQLETYYGDVEQYKESHPHYVEPNHNQFLYGVLSKKEIELWERSQGRPKEPPKSASELFLLRLDQAGKIPEDVFTKAERISYSDKKFKKLTWSDRRKYNDELKNESISYVKEMIVYFRDLPEFLRIALMDSVPSKYRHSIESQVSEDVEYTSDSSENLDHTDHEVSSSHRKAKKTTEANNRKKASKVNIIIMPR